MSWSNALLSDLAQPRIQPLFRLRVVPVNDVPGSPYVAASDPQIGDPVIAAGGVRVNGPALQPGSWSSTLGGFSVQLAGDLTDLKAAMTRGTFVELALGFPGYTDADYEILAVGQVQQLSASSPRSGLLSCRDLLSALRCRPTSTAGTAALGYRLTGAETTLAADYTAGDATLTLASVSSFGPGTATTQMACLVTPTTGDPFVLTYTGVGGSNLTGVAASAVHATTAVDAVTGDAVAPLLWIDAHPSSAVRALLLSVLGSGVHTYDVLPQGDGLSLPYAWFDHADTAIWKTYAEPTMTWQVMSAEAVTSPIGWIQTILGSGGFFLTVRMGLLTVRAALLSTSQQIPAVAEITDDDAEVAGWSWEAWDPDSSSESEDVIVYSSGGNTAAGAESPATLPTIARTEYDVSDLLFTDQATHRASILGRVTEAHRAVPERYTIQLAGLRLAWLSPGDRVRLYTRQIAGRMHQTAAGLDGMLGTVTQCSVDFGAGRVQVVVLVYPTSSVAFP